MKILFVTNRYHPNVGGGAELTVQEIAEEFRRRGDEVVVLTLSCDKTETADEVNGVRVIRVPIANLYVPFTGRHGRLVRMMWHLRDVRSAAMGKIVGRILEAEKPDWVSTHCLAGLTVAVWPEVKKRGIGLSHMLHDYYLLCPRATMFNGDTNCAGQCSFCKAVSAPKRTATELVDIVIGISHHVLDTHLGRGLFRRSKTAVVLNSRRLKGLESRGIDKRARGNPLHIGFMGRIEESKGLEVLLKAVSGLTGGGFSLLIAGNAPREEYLRFLKEKYPVKEASYVGFVSPAEFYGGIDVLVVPSIWHEPLGNVVYEAMGYGVPVVASRVGGIPEMLEGTGAGWLFTPGDAAELARILSTIIGIPTQLDVMSERAIERRRFFVPERQVDELVAAITAATAH